MKKGICCTAVAVLCGLLLLLTACGTNGRSFETQGSSVSKTTVSETASSVDNSGSIPAETQSDVCTKHADISGNRTVSNHVGDTGGTTGNIAEKSVEWEEDNAAEKTNGNNEADITSTGSKNAEETTTTVLRPANKGTTAAPIDDDGYGPIVKP